MKPEQLSDQQEAEIAAQVMRGERPKSELQKYGIQIGKPQGISVEDFQKQLQKEHAATQP